MNCENYFWMTLFLLLRTCSSSGIGKCPKYSYMKNFDLSKFTGDWFEVERSFYMMELASNCVTLHLEETDKRQLEVTVKTKARLPLRRTLCEGIASPTKKDPSYLLFKISSGLPYGLSNILPGAGFYQILNTDYNNYAIIWKCTSFGLFHVDSIWIFGRATYFNASIRAEIYNFLSKRKIDSERLTLPRNSNCTY